MQSMQRCRVCDSYRVQMQYVGSKLPYLSIYITCASKCIPTDLQTEKTGDQPMPNWQGVGFALSAKVIADDASRDTRYVTCSTLIAN